MNKLVVFAVLGLAVAGVAGVVLLINFSEFTYPHPSGERVVVTNSGVYAEKVMKMKQKLEEAEAKGQRPRAVADETSFDFGTMNPLTTASHNFYIRNEGDGPLQVHNAGTTCKCTLSKLSGGFVKPGEQVEVTLTWNTGRDVEYSHGATITTNDPDNRTIHLTVHGTVRTQLAATRQQLDFSHIEPDKTATVETVVYSQMFPEFTIRRVSCTIPGMTWEILPAEEEQLAELNATSGRALRVTTPSDLPKGVFQGELRLEIVAPAALPHEDGDDPISRNAAGDASDAPPQVADPASAGTQNPSSRQVAGETKDEQHADKERAPAQQASLQSHLLELTVSGTIGGRMSLSGREIDSTGTVDFGIINKGDEKKIRLLMKVYDKQCEIPVKRVDVAPEFVKVSVIPYGSNRPDLYFLELSVPADAPECLHLGKRAGKLRIEFDHPRIQDLELKLSLAVAPRSL